MLALTERGTAERDFVFGRTGEMSVCANNSERFGSRGSEHVDQHKNRRGEFACSWLNVDPG